MTEEPENARDREALAGEEALRLLGAGEMRDARTDPEFAGEAARWRGRLAPLTDEVEPVAPPAGLWDRIAQATVAPAASNDNVIALRRRLNTWRGFAGGMTAIAAALALVLLAQPRNLVAPPSPAGQVSPPMVAMLGDDRKEMKVVASWDPTGRRLVLAVAGDMPPDPTHAHELWVIPAGGKPRSLGTMGGEKQMYMSLEETLAELMRQGATIAISVEPPGGSATGAPTGPVIASGTLRSA